MSSKTARKIGQMNQEWKDALDVVEDPIFIHDKDFCILYCNRAYQRLAAIPFDQIIGQRYYDVFPKIPAPLPHCLYAMKNPPENEKTEEIKIGDAIFRSHAHALTNQKGDYLYSVHILKDITECKLTEEKYKALFNEAMDGIVLVDCTTWQIKDCNPEFEKQTGRTFAQLEDMKVWKVLSPEQHELARQSLLITQKIGNSRGTDFTLQKPDGEIIPIEFSAKFLNIQQHCFIQIVTRNITDRKQVEKSLKENEEKYRGIYENAQVGLYKTRVSDGKLVMANNAMARMFGYDSVDEATFQFISPEHYVDPGTREKLLDSLLKHGKFDNFEARLTRNDGVVRWFLLSGVFVQNNDYIEGVIIDITDQKVAEELIRRANRALRTLSGTNQALVRAKSEDALLKDVTDVIVQTSGYILAVVDYARDDPQKSLVPTAWSGYKKHDYWARDLSWGDNEKGQLPVGRAVRSAKTQICRSIADDPTFAPWREAALTRGYASNIALPLSGNGEIFGALSIYSSEKESFDTEEIKLLEELAEDLAYGITALRTHAEHEQHSKLLRQSLEQSIQIIAATVEARDPYTAGHQKRVSELATAIALEMRLGEEQVQGIRFAAMIHDLGKIHIPSEILSKPGELSDIEYMFIQTHPQAGYDILKDVKFPWPIADIILQHHEKLDGSGYPRGLKGDQILLEARIICVADVVEAMSSHRPYRTALGIEHALEEIRHGRGKVYDSGVVDAFLKLFVEKGFSFSSESA